MSNNLKNIINIVQHNVDNFEKTEKELLEELKDTDFKDSDFHPDFEIGKSVGFYEGMKYVLNMLKSN